MPERIVIRPVTRPGGDEPESAAEPKELAMTARARAREAMRCPFCHDDAPVRGALACARRGCGALYHAACWQECAASYGGCAVFGCGAREARALGRVGLLARFVRLVVAAWLFPPRLLRALLDDAADAVAVRAALRERAGRAADSVWQHGGLAQGARSPAALLGGILVSILQLLAALAGLAVALWAGVRVGEAVDCFSGMFTVLGITLAGVLAARAATWPLAYGLLLLRSALRGEVGALGRIGTTIDRMKRGGSGKSE